MIATIVTSVRRNHPTRYRWECCNADHKPTIGKWTLDRQQARNERDAHNLKHHTS